MRKVFALFLTVIMVFSLAGCNLKKTDSSEKSDKVKTKAVTEDKKDEAAQQENMIPNGEFNDGVGKWNTYTNGGSASLSVNSDKQLEIHITDAGTLDYAVQAYLDGFALETGCKYNFSFDISSSVERTGEWRIQINGGDYHAYVSDKVSLTTKMQHITNTFEMTEGSDPAPRLCLNLGMVEGCPENLGEHSVYVDNFELYLMDDSNKVEAAEEVKTPDINVNQIGYLPEDTKKAVLRGDEVDTEFEVVNAETGDSVYKGKVKDTNGNASSGENTGIADFSEVKEPGSYKIVSAKNGESNTFQIGDDIYDAITEDVLKMLYLQRCGQELSKENAGDYAHGACHTGEATIYGTDTKKDVSGGWHDAGDYGRYTVSGAKAVADILLAYENNPAIFGDASGIPESGNKIPDVLDEARYELEWLLKMQDEKSGGVYHKVTCANFPETVMPEEETEELILAPISNTATGDFAAVMAMAARIFKKTDSTFADTCLSAAKKAVKYAQSHEDAGFTNPEDIATGEYPDSNNKDELFWALAELYKTTQDKDYHKQLKQINVLSAPGGFGWQDVGYYGIWAYRTSSKQDKDYAKELQERFDYALNEITGNAKEDAYESTMGDTYCWGSNMVIANNAMLLWMADHLSPNSEYKALAKEQLHYLLGKNATSYCFVTGYGTLSPKNPHHRPSQVLESAMPGMLVGGPDSNLEDPYAKATLADTAPAKCYVDNVQSFSCNEVTVYWNSPLVYILSAMEN